MSGEVKEYLVYVIETLRRLSPSEKKLMLAFLENKAILARQIIAVSRSYGLSGIDTIRTLISLLKKDLVFSIFYFPEDVDRLFSMTAFPSKFLCFDEAVDISLVPRSLRDKLAVVLNDLRRAWDSTVADIGLFETYPQPRGSSPWKIIQRYYKSERVENLREFIFKILDQRVPGEDEFSYLKRAIPNSLLGLWISFQVSKLRGEGGLVNGIYPKMLLRVKDTLGRMLEANMLRNKKITESIVNQLRGILLFVSASLNEMFFAGIEITKDTATSILETSKSIIEMLSMRNISVDPLCDALDKLSEQIRTYL